ncbi:MAG: alpha/beta hydrolase fold domain-containing protein [Thermoguttaceae bacterium]|nr:alpha/beta hydrolase fold domain-containing protein [Thermoguttaceae bacterium]
MSSFPKSPAFRLVCRIIRWLGHKKFYASSGDAFWQKVLAQRPARGSAPGPLRIACMKLLGWHFERRILGGHPVYFMRPRKFDGSRTILYLHGGGFVNEAVNTHWDFLSWLLFQTRAQIVVPQYPLAPQANVLDVLPFLQKVYEYLLETDPPENIILMGDSAGGNLTLVCGMLFREMHLPQPRHLVMISPAMEMAAPDLDSDTEAREAEARDPMLSFGSFDTIFNAWRGPLAPEDWRVQPLFGDPAGLAPMTVFAGTDDILCRSAERFHEKVCRLNSNPDDPADPNDTPSEKSPIRLDFHRFPEMFHCWLLIPMPESRTARNFLKNIIHE